MMTVYEIRQIEEAAALLESLLINHPFVDSNKRVAFAACDIFLRINGYQLTASPTWLFKRMLVWIGDPLKRFKMIKQDLQKSIA